MQDRKDVRMTRKFFHSRESPTARPEDATSYLAVGGRDLRIDLLRGFFVVAMVVDHVAGASPLYLLTGGNRFYTSAAEGFILTSGLVAGLVYRKLIQRDGLSSSLARLMRRAISLYLLTVALTLLFVPVSEGLGLPWAQGVDLSNPLAFAVSVLTLHRTYYLVDLMLLYTILFCLRPGRAGRFGPWPSVATAGRGLAPMGAAPDFSRIRRATVAHCQQLLVPFFCLASAVL